MKILLLAKRGEGKVELTWNDVLCGACSQKRERRGEQKKKKGKCVRLSRFCPPLAGSPAARNNFMYTTYAHKDYSRDYDIISAYFTVRCSFRVIPAILPPPCPGRPGTRVCVRPRRSCAWRRRK